RRVRYVALKERHRIHRAHAKPWRIEDGVVVGSEAPVDRVDRDQGRPLPGRVPGPPDQRAPTAGEPDVAVAAGEGVGGAVSPPRGAALPPPRGPYVFDK